MEMASRAGPLRPSSGGAALLHIVAVQVAVVVALQLCFGRHVVLAVASHAVASAGERRLVEAIKSAPTSKGPVTVTLTEDIVLTKPLPDLVKGHIIVIGSCGARKCVIDGGGKHHIFMGNGDAAPRCHATFENLVFQNAVGSAVQGSCNLKLKGVHFKNNTKQSAVLIAYVDKWEIEDCLFENNRAEGMGAGVQVLLGGPGKLTRTTFKSNKGSLEGGALFIRYSATTHILDRVTFDSNTAGEAGGAIGLNGAHLGKNGSAVLFLADCKFNGNVATGGYGGALSITRPVEVRLCRTTLAGGRNQGKGGQGNDLAVKGEDFDFTGSQIIVSFCPNKPDTLSLFVASLTTLTLRDTCHNGCNMWPEPLPLRRI